MTNSLKNATLSVCITMYIMLLNTDLSYLTTYVKELTEKLVTLRKHDTQPVVQQSIYLLPDVEGIATFNNVKLNAQKVLVKQDGTQVEMNLPTLPSVTCEGSPSIRSP